MPYVLLKSHTLSETLLPIQYPPTACLYFEHLVYSEMRCRNEVLCSGHWSDKIKNNDALFHRKIESSFSIN